MVKYLAIAIITGVFVTFFVICKSKEEDAESSRAKEPLLRQFGELHPQDFVHHPVWVNCHIIDYNAPWYEKTDEETFRPWNKALPVDPAEAMFLVSALFSLADGTEMHGFITPQNQNDYGGKTNLGIIQPQMFLPAGNRVAFWFGILTPPPWEISSFYAVLGKSKQEVFPIAFETIEGLAKGIVSGSVPGFCSISDSEGIRITR